MAGDERTGGWHPPVQAWRTAVGIEEQKPVTKGFCYLGVAIGCFSVCIWQQWLLHLQISFYFAEHNDFQQVLHKWQVLW